MNKMLLIIAAIACVAFPNVVLGQAGVANFIAILGGDEENPPVTTDAFGTAIFSLSDAGLTYDITFEGIEIVASHFHAAPKGVNGGVVRAIDFAGANTVSGIWTPQDDQPLTDSLIAELIAGNIYVNLHTSAYPGGEIRGQVEVPGGILFSASLTGGQENPALVTDATGTGFFILVPDSLIYAISFEGITITASHFHLGATGVNGGVVNAIDFAGANFVIGAWTLTDSHLAELIAGNIYVNLHTSANPGGEIRGQVTLAGASDFQAILTGNQENPPVTTDATGTGAFSLTDAGLAYDITFEGIEIVASHFHLGATGVNGGVVRAIDFAGANTVSGIWTPQDDQPLTDSLLAEVVAGNIYVNLHTSANPGGEIRGQVTLSEETGFSAKLTGDQENPPVTTSATGTGSFSLDPTGLAYDITFEGIEIVASHFHLGATGVNGGVVRAIDFAGANTVSGIWTPQDDQPLTDSLIAELIAGNIYVNLHTSANPGGEIRGQLGTQVVVTAVEDEPTVIPQVFVLLQNYPNPFNPTTTIEYVLPKSAEVLLTIYNLRGQETARLVEGQRTGGYHRATWDASNVSSGIYFYRLQAGDFVQTRKMVLLK